MRYYQDCIELERIKISQMANQQRLFHGGGHELLNLCLNQLNIAILNRRNQGSSCKVYYIEGHGRI